MRLPSNAEVMLPWLDREDQIGVTMRCSHPRAIHSNLERDYWHFLCDVNQSFTWLWLGRRLVIGNARVKIDLLRPTSLQRRGRRTLLSKPISSEQHNCDQSFHDSPPCRWPDLQDPDSQNSTSARHLLFLQMRCAIGR